MTTRTVRRSSRRGRARASLAAALLAGLFLAGEHLTAQCPLTETETLDNPELQPDDRFGYSVAIDGNVAVVGVRFDHSPSGVKTGSASIFRFDGALWVLEASLNGDGSPSNDGEFGWDVAVSGDVVVIGNPQCRSPGCFESGRVFVYRHDGAAWQQEALLTASDAEPRDYFGNAVAIDGDAIVVGANHEDEGGFLAGAAYVYRSNGRNQWTQERKILPDDSQTQSTFGDSVAIDGDQIVVGASLDDADGLNSGAAYVFRRDQGGPDYWGQVARLSSSDAQTQDEQHFGMSVAVSDDHALVGAPITDGFTGAAYVFRRDHGGVDQWGQATKLTSSAGEFGDNFGASVDLDGATAIIGAVGDKEAGSWTGAAYVFARSDGTWSEQAKLTAQDGEAFHYFGTVALDSPTAVVGAPGNSIPSGGSVPSGAAYIFRGLSDCDASTGLDACELAAGARQDCNGNGVLDGCDIATGTSLDLDESGVPDECAAPPLSANPLALSLTTGGVQSFLLNAGAQPVLNLYLVLGSQSGTSPGVAIDAEVLPLNLDTYFLYSVENPNSLALTNTLGILSPDGTNPAPVSFNLPTGLDVGLAGATLHHAYAVFDLTTLPGSPSVSFVSNPVPLALLP